ncbi:thymus-specific serine protease isoform X1 [Camelus ferus]|uniref:Thymus-specific serine protease n=1 Tax=Camelus ferus TaxID=419612 RepID=A0A8B8RPK1_CAMFR|nr:thymus-specific serine protease isoform X1 [Camelus ferus]
MQVMERGSLGPGSESSLTQPLRSPQCRAAASAAFAEVKRRLRAGGAAQAALRAELGACGSLGRSEDQAELLGTLQALVGGAVQYDGQVGAPLSVRQLCGLLLGDRDNCSSPAAPYRGLRRAVQVVTRSLGQRCLSFSRAETVTQLRVTEPQVSGVGDRQWLYQTCTEFGYYVTCEDPGCPFSQLPALPSQLDLCEQVFGLSTSSIAKAVAQTNSYYGGQTPGATQVLFVNGDTDPWHVLSVTQALGPSEAVLLIPNASHCLDMAPERPSDPPSLLLARQCWGLTFQILPTSPQNIFQQLQTWLQLAKESQVRFGTPTRSLRDFFRSPPCSASLCSCFRYTAKAEPKLFPNLGGAGGSEAGQHHPRRLPWEGRPLAATSGHLGAETCRFRGFNGQLADFRRERNSPAGLGTGLQWVYLRV